MSDERDWPEVGSKWLCDATGETMHVTQHRADGWVDVDGPSMRRTAEFLRRCGWKRIDLPRVCRSADELKRGMKLEYVSEVTRSSWTGTVDRDGRLPNDWGMSIQAISEGRVTILAEAGEAKVSSLAAVDDVTITPLPGRVLHAGAGLTGGGLITSITVDKHFRVSVADPRPPVNSRWQRRGTDQILRVVEHVDSGELPARRRLPAFRYVREGEPEAGVMEYHLEAFNDVLYVRLPDVEPAKSAPVSEAGNETEAAIDRMRRAREKWYWRSAEEMRTGPSFLDFLRDEMIVDGLLPAAPEIGNSPGAERESPSFRPPELDAFAERGFKRINGPGAACRRCGERPCADSCSSGEGYRRIVEAKRKAEGERAKREEEAKQRGERERSRARSDAMTFTPEQAHVDIRLAKQAKVDHAAAREASAASERPYAWVIR